MASASPPRCFIRKSSTAPSWAASAWMWTRSSHPISGNGISLDDLLGFWRTASTCLLIDEPTQLDRGFRALDIEHVEATGPPFEPACGRPSPSGQVGFLVLVGGVVGNQL